MEDRLNRVQAKGYHGFIWVDVRDCRDRGFTGSKWCLDVLGHSPDELTRLSDVAYCPFCSRHQGGQITGLLSHLVREHYHLAVYCYSCKWVSARVVSEGHKHGCVDMDRTAVVPFQAEDFSLDTPPKPPKKTTPGSKKGSKGKSSAKLAMKSEPAPPPALQPLPAGTGLQQGGRGSPAQVLSIPMRPGVSLAGSSQPGVTFTQARYSDSYSPAPGSSRGDGAWALGGYAPSRQDDGFQAARQYLGVSTAPPAGAMERPAIPILMQQPDGSQLQVPADLAQELLQRIMQFRGTSQ